MTTSFQPPSSPDASLLMQAMEASPHGFALEQADTDGGWRIIHANRAFGRLTRTGRFGYNGPASVLLPWWTALAAPNAPSPLPPTVFTVETDAGPRQIEARATLLKSPASSPAHRTLLLTEMTNLVSREAEARLVQMHGLLTAVYEAVPAGLCLVGAGRVVELCNDGFAQLFSTTLEDVSGKPVTDYVPAVLWTRACAALPGTAPITGTCKDAGGREFPVEAIVTRLDTRDTSWSLLTLQDLTERRRTEVRLHEARQLEGLATLAGGVAHDFNNALAIILGYGGLLTDFADDPKQLKQAADHIMTAARRGADVVRQLQVFANVHECTLSPQDLHELIGETISRVTGDWPVTVRLQVVLAAPPTALSLDAPQVMLAIQHLLQNARDALPAGAGDIVVRTSVADRAAVPMHVLTVEDNGTGMDEATRARIFEPFFAKDRGPQVRGLGLAVVYGILKAHGGRVEVDSSPHGGTRVRLLFPCPPMAAIPVAPPAATIPPSDARTVLLVEDEPGIGQLWTQLLERQGWTVHWSENARDAFAFFEAHRAECVLLFTDVGLPDEDGIQLAYRIRALAPAIPVLLTSGAFKSGVQENTPLAEPVGYLPKPCEFAQFEAELRALGLQPPR